MLSTKTSKVLAVFMAVSTTVAFASWMAQDVDIPAEQETGPQTLLDDEGREYTLTQNADGTETATYGDGSSVTVKREENGSLRYISGAEGLIAGLAAGYYMFHGLSGGTGGRYSVVQGRYIPNGPVQPLQEKDDYRSSGGSSSSSSSRRITVNKGSSSSKSSSSAKSSSHSSSKSGFGSAGARSSAS